jgi:cell division transport system permease protein
LRNLSYFLIRAFRNMRQSLFLCTAAVSTVTVALVILAVFALVVLNVEQLTSNWSKEVQIIAYLDQIPPGAELDRQMERLRQFPEVLSVDFVSRQQAYQRFRQRLGQDADLLAGVDEAFLPASLEIRMRPKFRNRQGVEQVVAKLRGDRLYSELHYGQDWLERFEAFLSLLQLSGLVLGGFLLFAALFIVANTIRLTLFARREELEVMSLVGGTPVFIKTPFFIEGAVQGAVGGLLALGCVYGLFRVFLREDLTALLLTSGLGRIVFLPPNWQLGLVLLGTGLGLFGSMFSLHRLARV